MDSQRNILLGAFLLVCFLIWQAWQQDNAPHPVVQPQIVSSSTHQINGALGGTSNNNTVGKQIHVKTDVLNITINTQGGTLDSAALLKYDATLGSTAPLMLLQTSPQFLYQAESALIPQGQSTNQLFAPQTKQMVFSSQHSNYLMTANQNTLEVPLTYKTSNGVEITKIFIFKRGQYDIHVKYEVNNPTSSALNLVMVGQLRQSNNVPKNATTKTSSGFGMHEYRGTAYSSQSDKYKKYSLDDVKDGNLNISTQGGWVAMLQQYFATAWVPPANTQNKFYTKSLPQLDQSIIGFQTAPITIAPNSQGSISSQLWVGPELQDAMAKVAPHLDLSVDYGWLWFISQPLFKLLQFIQKFVHNWGVAIIIITFIVRGIMYPLTRAQYTSMAKMKLLQPRIQAMKERLGDDKQRASQEMMALYRKEKVNPLGGCLPLVVQMPIFLALYYMLGSSVELRHAPFTLWIHDLSAPDPYYILPLIMGLTMFLIQKMSPTPVADPMQQKMMTFMPVIFTVFFLWFPSGLVLYYIVSNLVTITQQKIIYRGLEKRGLHTRAKKKK